MLERRINRRRFLEVTGAAGATVAFGNALKSSGPVKIGFLTAFTGIETILGLTQYNCFKMAVDEINAKGGIAGRTIQVFKEDDHTDTHTTISKMDKLVKQDGVGVTIGLISSLERQAAMSVAPRLGGLVMYTTYYEGGVCNKYLISTGQVPNQQIDPMIPYLMKHVGKSLFVVGSDYVWPRGSADWIKKRITEHGGTYLGDIFFPFGTTDFSPAIRAIRAKKPNIVWQMVVGSDSVTWAKQFHEAGLKVQLASSGIDEIGTYTTPAAYAGALVNQAWFMTLGTPASKQFVQKYHKLFGPGKPIDAIAEAAYDSVYLYKAAVEKAGSTDTDKVLKAFPEVGFNAPQGHVTIDKKTQVMVCHSLLGIAQPNGAIKILENFGPIKPVVPCLRKA